MMIVKPRAGYSSSQIALHWLIALLVLFQLVFGESMNRLVDGVREGRAVSTTDQTLGNLHYWIGLTILGLVVIRLALRLVDGAPSPALRGPVWMEQAARLSHWSFYALLVATPILGLLAFYVGRPFGWIHGWSKPVFIVLIGIHAAAALFHQFWLKDGTFRRMIVPAR